MQGSVSRHSSIAGSLPWAPRALWEVCVPVRDGSHCGLSLQPLSLSLCIPSIPINGRRKGKGEEAGDHYLGLQGQWYSFRFKKPGLESWFCHAVL